MEVLVCAHLKISFYYLFIFIVIKILHEDICVHYVLLGAHESGEEWNPTELVLDTVVSCCVSSDNPAKVLCKGNQCL